MKSFTYTLILLYFYIFSSCKGDSSNSAPFDGVFVTESGIKFELKEDSTTLILFDDTLNYEGVWSIHHTNESEYANIEFAGKPDYYYLRWVLSIPFFISCIRQQNPLTVLSKIILRKVKQFNLPPPKKNEGFLHF